MKKRFIIAIASLFVIPLLAGCGQIVKTLNAYFIVKDVDSYGSIVNYLIYTDKNVRFGGTPEYKGDTPTKKPTDIYTYTFDHWEPALGPIKEDTQYYAVFTSTLRKYTVTWINEDGTLLDSQEVDALTTPSYNGEIPTKEGNEKYSYTFANWDKEYEVVKSDQVYKATYTQSINKYTVTFKNYDGEILSQQDYEYDSLPKPPTETPVKPEDDFISYYEFIGWDKPIEYVKGEQTYIAQFKEYSVEDVLDYELSSDETYYIVKGFKEVELKTICKKVIIPDTYNNLPVKEIKNGAFYNCSKINVLKLGNNIEKIGQTAFGYCVNIPDFDIPDSVKEIGNYAFSNCTKLTHLYLSNNIEKIGQGAFNYCINISKFHLPFVGGDRTSPETGFFKFIFGALYPSSRVDLPLEIEELVVDDSCPSLYDGAFNGISDVKNFYISKNTANLAANYAFPGCNNLYFKGTILDWLGYDHCQTSYSSVSNFYLLNSSNEYELFPKNIVLPEGFKILHKYAFANSYIESITLPSTIQEIGEYAFYGCKDLTSITLPTNCSISTINKYAFYGCEKITSFAIPNNVTIIDEHAFNGCSGLSTVTFNDGLETIASSAFSGCSSLTGIDLPSSVTTIGSNAFSKCRRVTSFTLPSSTSFWAIDMFGTDNNVTTFDTGDNLTELPVAFATYFPNITTLKIGKNVSKGLTDSLYLLKHLETLEIDPDNETYVLDDGLVLSKDETKLIYCLKEIEGKFTSIPLTINEICEHAFEGQTKVTRINIPSTVKKIDDYAFRNCTSMDDMIIPKTVEEIGFDILSGCTSLEVLDIPFVGRTTNQLKWVNYFFGSADPNGSYRAPSSLTRINVTGSSEIPYHAFFNIPSLWKVTFSDTTPSIAKGAFGGSYVREIITPILGDNDENQNLAYMYGADSYENGESVISIYLKKITLTKGTELQEGAFCGAQQVNEINLPLSLETIKKDAFKNCYHLCKFNIPEGVTTIENDAFANNYCLRRLYVKSSISIPYSKDIGLDSNYNRIVREESQYGIYNINDYIIYIDSDGDRCVLGYEKETADIVINSGSENNLVAFDDYSFYKNPFLTSLTIANSKFRLFLKYSFEECKKLKTLTLTNATIFEGFGMYAFKNCTALRNLYLPKSLKTLGVQCFYNCTALENIYYAGTTSEWGNVTNGSWHYNVPAKFVHCSNDDANI